MKSGRWLGLAGRGLIGIGIFILLFVGYQIWGTAISQAHSQGHLRSELNRQLGTIHSPEAGPSTNHTSTTTTPQAPPRVVPPMPDPPVNQPVAVISIPKIHLNQVVVEGTAEAQLAMGPGHYLGTPLPGEAGNVAIAGHRTTFGHPFYNLNELTPGDDIDLTTSQGYFTYRVVSSTVVSPKDVAVIAPTSTPELTLTTCNPRYSASTRLVVQAVLSSSTPTNPPSSSPSTTNPAKPSGLQGSSTSKSAESNPGIGAAIGWGAAFVGMLLAAWALARRLRPARRAWIAYVVGCVVLLPLLYLFFEAITPLLPASF